VYYGATQRLGRAKEWRPVSGIEPGAQPCWSITGGIVLRSKDVDRDELLHLKAVG
jgi:hypothetical protein